ncbi:MerR family transcriptional regulator [Streptomyces davaonensis JCM 4913]|uniref:MerR family transcriptional regulator n=1 Tax=Streptomyces davaonensis (strain DSM 101723 / JCM 4913 / KCC S-0913 / 768) TaxID=1214101 RepID=K4QVW6_STRDJ|nr:MerR family transcriptional regulator [Streptomyces davaonensis]CCK25178.1 MerR family transcriptional regulator [Streptomyces davaonensis JCM 4913]
MNGDTLSIGELARRTGLTVKTVRLYSDRGIVTPAERTPAGYRRYTPEAVARLAFVRTLRELGLGLATIRRILDRELPLDEVAARHAAALDAQISALHLRRAVLTAVAARTPTTPEELRRMHHLARLTAIERRRLVDEFLDSVLDEVPAHFAIRRSMTPEPPDDPTQAQAEAWLELAELSLDPDFRDAVRRLAEYHVRHASCPPLPDAVALAHRHAGPALAAGIAPDSRDADPAVAALTADTGPDLLQRLESADDPRRDRYFELLAVINDWPPPEPHTPVIRWTVAALRARAA